LEHQKFVLHVGSGHKENGAELLGYFKSPEWQEIRLDIDPKVEPDILGSMLDMTEVKSDSMDAVYSAHNIEHVYPHEVPIVLSEFLRVLKINGVLVVTCPDLQSVCALVAQEYLTDAAYNSQAGPIAPIDMLYGHRGALAAGHHYMAHKGGFTEKTLMASLKEAGFGSIGCKRRPKSFDLWAIAINGVISKNHLHAIADKLLP
jgi:protein O-GlcNAc transferase